VEISDQPHESQISFSEHCQSSSIILPDLNETFISFPDTLESNFQQSTRPHLQFCDVGSENSLSTDKIMQPKCKPQNMPYSADKFSHYKSKCMQYVIQSI